MASVSSPFKRALLPASKKKRGSYNCGRCGAPKKGHVCTLTGTGTGTGLGLGSSPRPGPAPRSRSRLRLRLMRALSFDAPPGPHEDGDDDEEQQEAEADEEQDDEDHHLSEHQHELVGVGSAGLVPLTSLVQVFRRVPLKALFAAAAVCRGWRHCVKRMWRSAEELSICVSRISITFLDSILQKCTALLRLTLRMQSDVNSTLLGCIAFFCPKLQVLEITLTAGAVNKINGVGLSRFVAEMRCLSVLKIEGCTNLEYISLSSTSLSILWLSDLACLSKSVFNCPNMTELSLDFTREGNDSTDLPALMENLGRTCLKLRNLHVASIWLCNEAVLALASADLRFLQMLSLLLGSRITDAAVASIVQSYLNLELLDLSGSSITDRGIGMICQAYPHTLSRLLLALCPNITTSGVQLATSLPYLQLLDCGMSISTAHPQTEEKEMHCIEETDSLRKRQQFSNIKKPYQKLIIKHPNLKRLSLWGCSALEGLYVNCPELEDLNLNSCANLHPEKLLLQCPILEKVHASGCQDMLIGAIRNQVLNEFAAARLDWPCKRLADRSSKRVLVPSMFPYVGTSDEEQKGKRLRLGQCAVHSY
ncbi:F-box/LRR-repeat protein 17 [Rhynchospora pubera]|uniref:F-box/LRR-repeat protein 17 n=1 Tax=Rhynchospora pubera TaxID=906938 RepID=A0AAV8H3W7_9POAL|nr:F-box/LRR-repeat protein 17 [Rhynchospora pubera]KAJ4809462.1 F-box/LRR-repeat protein 17 [Rhynchospora pubera]